MLTTWISDVFAVAVGSVAMAVILMLLSERMFVYL